MHTPRISVRVFAVIVALVIAPLRTSTAQEWGLFGGGGASGIPDVHWPYGGGGEAAFLHHDWIGAQADVGYYQAIGHRTVMVCTRGTGEPIPCALDRVTSWSSFPQVEAMFIVRTHVPGRGIRVEAGVGPMWVDLSNQLTTPRDSLYSPEHSQSVAGAVFMVGVLVHPPWDIPIELKGAYLHHVTGTLGNCSGVNDPICDRRLHFQEFRLSFFKRPRPAKTSPLRVE